MCNHLLLNVYVNYCRVYVKTDSNIKCHGFRVCRLMCQYCKTLFAIKASITYDKKAVLSPGCEYYNLAKMEMKFKYNFGQYIHNERNWQDYYKFLEPLLKAEPDFIRKFDIDNSRMEGPSQKEIELVGKLDAEIPYECNKFMEWFVHPRFRQHAFINNCWLD